MTEFKSEESFWHHVGIPVGPREGQTIASVNLGPQSAPPESPHTLTDFARDWQELQAAWCLGGRLEVPADDAWEALRVLERLWLDHLTGTLGKSVRSPFILSWLVREGQTLRRCEKLENFAQVLHRVRNGDRGAMSELYLAAKLVDLGYEPRLEPYVHDRRPDVIVSEGGAEIIAEVVSPQFSEYGRQLNDRLSLLAHTLKSRCLGSSIEVFLLEDPVDEISQLVIEEVVQRWSGNRLGVMHLDGVASARIEPFTRQVTAFEPVHVDSHVKLGVVAFDLGPQLNTRVNVVIPFNDTRAGRLVDQERHHFRKGTLNLLVIDVSGIPNGLRKWGKLVSKRLQPSLNRTFGGVLLFQNEPSPVNVLWRSTLISNPHAYAPLPTIFLSKLS